MVLLSQITMPVRVLKLLGVEILIVTNASGGLNENFSHGDIMILSDHINMVGMTGFNPLIGENEDRCAIMGRGVGSLEVSLVPRRKIRIFRRGTRLIGD